MRKRKNLGEMTMPVYRPNSDPEERDTTNFNQCLIYVQRTFPDEPEDIQYKMARAVFGITEVFFNEILPKVIKQTLSTSLN